MFHKNILFGGVPTKLDNRKFCGMGCMTTTPWNGNYRGVGGLKKKGPSIGVRGGVIMDVFWNYTLQGQFTHIITVNCKL